AASAASPATQPAALLDAGLEALAAGDTDRAAALLGVAVRVGPHLAPRIVDATMDTEVPAILLVRGDALRATGHDAQATEAYAAAAVALGADAAAGDPPGLPPGPDPSDEPGTPDPDAAVPYGPT